MFISENTVAPARPKVSRLEFQALKHIHHALHHDHICPTSRSVAKAIGFTSSRSGHRMIKVLIGRGLIYRDVEGNIGMSDDAKGCEPRIEILSSIPS